MPELPEVEALARFVSERATGRTVERIEVGSLSALKTFDPPLAVWRGETVVGVTRRGKYLCIEAGRRSLVIHLARGGWLVWRDKAPAARAKPGRGPLALRVGLSDGAGFDLTEQGTEKRLAFWLVDDAAAVPGVARLGPEPLDPELDVAALGQVIAGRPGNLKRLLTDQSALAGIGNAYSDEILHAARLSPFKPAARLGDDELANLHAAIVEVLTDAVERSIGLAAARLKGEKRQGLAVHGRPGEPCGACGDTVREVSFATTSLQYCPTCQTKGRLLADRRLSRLLK